MVNAKLAVMGDIITKEPDGTELHFPMALLLEFQSVADIRQAIADGECKFKFMEAA